MVERTGVRTGWAARIREDLERTRERLREAPEGPSALEEEARRRFRARQEALAREAPGAPSPDAVPPPAEPESPPAEGLDVPEPGLSRP